MPINWKLTVYNKTVNIVVFLSFLFYVGFLHILFLFLLPKQPLFSLRKMWCSNLQRLTFQKCDNYWFFWMLDIYLQPYCNLIVPTSVSSHKFWRVHKMKFTRNSCNTSFFYNIHNQTYTTCNCDSNN